MIDLRKRVGMVFQKSNPFPKSIYENVAYGLRVAGIRKRSRIDEAVEKSLRSRRAVGRSQGPAEREREWDCPAASNSGLCIARAIAVEPEIILMDEPCSALDPIATAKIEELIHAVEAHYTIVIVTHNMQQAARISDNTAFFYLGKLIEYRHHPQDLHQPRQKANRRLRHRPLRIITGLNFGADTKVAMVTSTLLLSCQTQAGFSLDRPVLRSISQMPTIRHLAISGTTQMQSPPISQAEIDARISSHVDELLECGGLSKAPRSPRTSS